MSSLITWTDDAFLSRLDGCHRWLVTGCAGFIGSNLVEALLRLNQDVVGLDNFSTGYQHNLDAVRALVGPDHWRRFTFIEGDICDSAICAQAMTGIDFVLHQAALGSVPRSVEDPVSTNLHNISGFLSVLDQARRANVAGFVYASSSAVYGDDPRLPKQEEQTGRLLSPYAVTKWVNELYADTFSRVYGIGTVGLRYFNVFGARQDPDGAYAAVIPRWTAAMIDDQDVTIFGDGETSRDFSYIANVVQMNLRAALSCRPGEALVSNVAGGDRTTLNQLFDALRDGLSQHQIHYARDPVFNDFRVGDIRHSLADLDRARSVLGYSPTHSLRDGLTEALPYYISLKQSGTAT
jgi:UDP-N-acetylglucosamine/UDP-N-acetylgalactosamine 4-epimerase